MSSPPLPLAVTVSMPVTAVDHEAIADALVLDEDLRRPAR